MPGASHFLYGLAFILPLMLFAREKVNSKAAIIFVLNNLCGPDSYWPFAFIPLNGHSLLGYPIWAVLLAFFYSYLSRFSLQRTRGRFWLQDDGHNEVGWTNAYLLCVAGGICHFFIDMIGHLELDFPLVQEIYIPWESIQGWGAAYAHVFTPLVVIGYAFQIAGALLTIHVLTKDTKNQYVFFAVFAGAIVLTTLIVGGFAFGELEVTMVFLIGVFFFTPFTLVAWVFKRLHDHPEVPQPSRFSVQQKLRIVFCMLIGLGLLLLVASIVGGIYANQIGDYFGIGGLIVQIGAVAVGIASLVWLIFTFLMIVKRSEKARQVVSGICLLVFVAILPPVLALILNEKEVIAEFSATK